MKKNAHPQTAEASALHKRHSSPKPSTHSTQPTKQLEGNICQGVTITGCDRLEVRFGRALISAMDRPKAYPAILRDEG